MSPRTRTRLAALAVLGAGSLVLSACGSGFDGGSSAKGDGELTVLIGSSGTAETVAVKKAVAAWSKESGVKATVSVASDLPQQLSQGFAASNPPDVFYASTDQVAGYAANGSLYAYGDQLKDAGAFYPTLTDAFTVDGELQCAPKDFSTLQLVINTRLWKAAGLTDADVPTTWDQLATVAKRLTEGKRVGLAMSPEYARVGAFMAQAGGGLTDGDRATVDSSENTEALDYVQALLKDGSAAWSSDLGAGWGGEAFGKQLSAMTIEGSWIAGALSADHPDLDYTVAPLPKGPGGQGTLAFTNCWGIAADSGDRADAVKLVEALVAPEQQLDFARAFGVIPSVQSAGEQWAKEEPRFAPFVDGAAYAQNPPSQRGTADVVADLNSQLGGLRTGKPADILASVQKELQAALDADR